MSGFEGNVLIEVLGRSGILLRRRRGSNAITRAGKSWAINRWAAGSRSVVYTGSPQPVAGLGSSLSGARLEINAGGTWQNMTIEAGARTRANNIVTMTGTYRNTGTTAVDITNARINTLPASDATGKGRIAFFSILPTESLGAGQTIRVEWTLRVTYSAGAGANDEISEVRETAGGPKTADNLWEPGTDAPRVANELMHMLFADRPASQPASRFSHAQIRFFQIDFTGLTEDQQNDLGDSGPFPIVQLSANLVHGRFTTATADPLEMQLGFSWDGAGVPAAGVLRKRWYQITGGNSQTNAGTTILAAGAILEGDNIPTAATTYTTRGIYLPA